MSAGKPKPTRRKKSPAARLRPFWIVIALVLVAAAAGGYYAASWPGFHPANVRVRGNAVVPTGEILSAAAIARSQNVWLQNTRAAARRIEAIPYVATARVRRTPPANVLIVITERVPYAVLRDGADRALVDRELRVLSNEPGSRTLPVFDVRVASAFTPGAFVRNAVARRLRDDYDALLAGHVIVSSLSYDRFGDLDATVRPGIRILFGDDVNLAKKIPLVDPILSQVARKGRPIRAIDLRAKSTPVIVYKK
ncbi:MAG TPA: FtsQ-type POTRA domain-containing protein [Candidatus Baltobacteraceae bacterium]|jgi:cell division protein FtsQ